MTVLIQSRNRAGDLRRCLAAVEQSQERDTIEVIVVDSGSTDGSATLDHEFPSAQFLRLPKNFGLNRALNIGTRTAKGDLLLLLPQDAEVAPDTISRLATRLEAGDDTGAVCPYVAQVRRLPSTDDFWMAYTSRTLPPAVAVDPNAAEVEVEYPAGAPFMLRRTFLKGMNYVDARFSHYWIDAEICYQLRSGGKRILVLPQVKLLRDPQPPVLEDDPVHTADLALGAAAYLGKHGGGGVGFRGKAALAALGRALTFQRPGYNAKLFGALLTGQRIDGTHE